ncbi:MAG: hypothetical protein QG614_646, partial [Patescibacteria group bacterium]|nr:hypothetical protein [Patescibacteria group bacterium]
GLNYSTYGPGCTCPYGQTQSGSSCVSQSCPNGLNYSTYGHGCTCPYGQTQSGSSCVTASAPVCGSTANTCSSGDLVNDYFSGASATWQCMNSVGTKTSCSSSCPSGQTYTCNGTLAGSGICLGTLSCNTIAYTISLSGSNCTINPGQSSCQGTLNWSSTYPTYQSWNITGPGAPTGGYASWNGSSHLGNGYPTLPYGVGIYYYNAGSKTTSYSLQATCATGTTWDGSKCACPAGYAISGTQCIKYAASISATPTCNIVPGRSTCKSTLNWSATSNANSGWTISSSPNSSPSTVNVQGNNNTGSQAVDVTNGTTIFTLNTGGTITPNPTANTVAKCQDTGTAWDGSKCPLTLDLPTSYENEKGKDFTMTWKSNGNECVIKDNNNQPIATTTSSTNNFSYNFSVAANPYLNTNGNYKYNVSCYYKNGTDYGTPITKSTTLTVYEKVTAYITDNNNGSATLGCKGSWNTASLIASTTSGVNTRQFTNDGTNIFPITYSLSGNPTLTLTCVGKNTDVAILPKGTLSLAGTVSSATRAPISTSTVTSSDEIMYIDYTSSNGVFDISYTATGVTAIQYAEVIGDPNVNPSTITALDSNKPISDTILNASYPSGATIKIVATKNGIYKTLILRLRNSQTPKAQLTNLSTSNVSGVCYNSTSYDLKLGGVSVKSGSIAAANFDSYNINYNYTMPPLLSKQSVSLTCGFAGNTDTATGEVIDASKQTAEILRFSAYPPELACGGGKAILTWEVKYSAGKNCHIESEVTTKNSSVLNADKTLALSKISSAINTDSNYKTLIATTTKVTKGNIFDITDSNYISKGQLSNVVTTFSTRYYLVCGTLPKIFQ